MPSRPTGKPDPARDDAPGGASTDADGRLAVELFHARGQHLRWIAIGLIVGALCISGLGTLGQGIGVVLVAWGLWNAWQALQTFRHPAGTVVVAGDDVELPRGLCRGAPEKLRKADVTAVYFLRRSVSWTQAAPVLVVEARGHAFVYPRDWFGSESDQRRIVDELAPT
ncbi:MAG: hypothetical protein IPL61_16695 [Myxococcales bacterium]|nr:hypothetical protein [Myxococcales bacterium]